MGTSRHLGAFAWILPKSGLPFRAMKLGTKFPICFECDVFRTVKFSRMTMEEFASSAALPAGFAASLVLFTETPLKTHSNCPRFSL